MPEATMDTRKVPKPGGWTGSTPMPVNEPVYIAPPPGFENDPLAQAESARRFEEDKRKAELERERLRREQQEREKAERLKREAEAKGNGAKQAPGQGAPSEEENSGDSGAQDPMSTQDGAEGQEKKQEQEQGAAGAGELAKGETVDPEEKRKKEDKTKAKEQQLADELLKQEAKERDIQEKRGRNRALIREAFKNPVDESKGATREYADLQRRLSIARYLVVFEGESSKEAIDNYEVARTKYAQKQLGNESATDKQVHEHIQSELDLNDAISDMAFNAATDNLLPPAEAYLKGRAELMKQKGYRAEREPEYLGQFSATQRDASRQMAPLRDEARNVIGILQGARTDGEVAAALPYILNRSESEMGLMWHLMHHEAVRQQREMGLGEQSSMAVERSFHNIGRKMLRTVENIRNSTAIAHLREGMSVPAHLKTPEEIVQWKSLQLLEAREAALDGGGGGLGYMLQRSLDTTEYRKLSKEQHEEIKALPTKLAKSQHAIAKFVNFQQDTLDPIVGDNWFTRNLYYPALGSTGELAFAALPFGVGLPVLAMSAADDHYYKLIEAGVPHEAAFRDSLWVGSAQAAMERFNPAALTRKLPLTKGVMERFQARPGGYVMQFGIQTGTMTAEQTVVAQFQAHIIPALISDISKVQGDVEWLEEGGPIDMAIKTAPETAGGVLLLGLVASGFATVSDARLSREVMQSPVTLMQAGFSPKEAMEIRAAAMQSQAQGVAAMRVRWKDRDGSMGTMQEAGLRARQEAQLNKAVVEELESSGVLPPVMQTKAGTAAGGKPGFAVRLREDAEPLRFKTRAEAEAVRWQWAQDKHPKLGEKVAEITVRLKEGNTSLTDPNAVSDEQRIEFSIGEVDPVARRAMELGADSRRFRRGKASGSKDLAQIFSDYSLKENEVVLSPNPPKNDTIAQSFLVTHKAGGRAVVNVTKDGTVWVDTQEMGDVARDPVTGLEIPKEEGAQPEPIKGGDLVYQAAMTYAYNNGLKFRSDPSGTTAIAKGRRISHMISSALRHGTTRHLSPYGQKKKDNDLVANEWRNEDTPEAFEHNVGLMLRAEMEFVERAMAGTDVKLGDLRYDRESDNVLQQTKDEHGTLAGWRRISERDFKNVVEGLVSRNSGVGSTTLSRALITKSELERHAAGLGGGTHVETAELLGGREIPPGAGVELFRLLGTAETPKQLYYSRGESTGSERVQRTGVTQAETTAAEARLKSTAQGRAIYGNVLIVDNRAALDGLQGRPGQSRYHAEDWDLMRDAEGFHDPRDGTVVVFRENVRVLEGENAAQAMARVVVHERVGHHGFDALRASDSEFAKTWSQLAQAIPQKEMQELEVRYTHLRGNRDALALEWFAQRVGNMEGRAQLEPGSLPQRMWQAMRDWVTRYYNPLGDPGKQMTQEAIDAHVRGLIKATQRSMVKERKSNKRSDVSPSDRTTLLSGIRAQFSVPKREGNSNQSGSGEQTDSQPPPSEQPLQNPNERARLKGTKSEKETVVPDKASFRDNPFESGLIKIEETDSENVIQGSFKVKSGEATFIFEGDRKGDTLIIGNAHIEGDATIQEVFLMAQAIGREQGMKYVIIQGGKRSTGSKHDQGLEHIPRPIKLKTGL